MELFFSSEVLCRFKIKMDAKTNLIQNIKGGISDRSGSKLQSTGYHVPVTSFSEVLMLIVFLSQRHSTMTQATVN